MFLLKLALRPWRLAPASHFFSALAVGFLLLLAGLMSWMQAGLKPVLARLQGEQVVTAYLDAGVPPEGEDKVVDSIRVSLGAHAATSEIRLVTSSQFVSRLKERYPDLSRELEDLGPEMGTVVPRYVSVAGILPDQAIERIRAVPGIESAETSKDRYAQVAGAFVALRWVARLLVVGVGLALLTGLLHLARTNAYLHREALLILKHWGASAAELRAPGMISGALVGGAGGLFAACAWLTAGQWFGHQIRSLSPWLKDLPPAGLATGAALLAAGLLIGIFAGALGGLAGSPEDAAQTHV